MTDRLAIIKAKQSGQPQTTNDAYIARLWSDVDYLIRRVETLQTFIGELRHELIEAAYQSENNPDYDGVDELDAMAKKCLEVLRQEVPADD